MLNRRRFLKTGLDKVVLNFLAFQPLMSKYLYISAGILSHTNTLLVLSRIQY